MTTRFENYTGLRVQDLGVGERETRWYCKGMVAGMAPWGTAALRWTTQEADAERVVAVVIEWDGEEHEMSWSEFDAWLADA